MEATQYLINQHRTLESAMRRALATEDGGSKRSQFLDIADALSVHIAAEEKLLYPAAHENPTEDILLESLEEHLSMKRLIADLLVLDGSDETFQPKLKVLMEQAEHHHKEEENKLFPRVRADMSRGQRAELADAMAKLQTELEVAGKPRCAVLAQTTAAEPLS